MGPVIRNSVLGTIFIFAAVTRVSAQAPAAPPPNAAKIPLSKIPRVHHAPNWKISWRIIRAKRN